MEKEDYIKPVPLPGTSGGWEVISEGRAMSVEELTEWVDHGDAGRRRLVGHAAEVEGEGICLPWLA